MDKKTFRSLILSLVGNVDDRGMVTIKMLDSTELIMYAGEDDVVMGETGFCIYAGNDDDANIRAVGKYKNVDALYKGGSN